MPYPWNSNDTLTAGDLNAAIGMASGSGAGTANAGRNLIHNSMFSVVQRTGPFTANGYTLDRWALSLVSDTASIRQVALSNSDRAAIGDEAATFAVQNNNFTGSAAPGAYSLLIQYIEGVRRLSGKTVTVSFWANATSALKLGVSAVQVFGSGGSGPAPINGQAVTLSTSWARYSVTLSLPSVASQTVGTTGDSTALYFWYSAGSGNAAQSGGVGQQSGTVNIWGVQLEIGSTVTPFEKPDPQKIVAECMRFYYAGTFNVGLYGAAGGGVNYTLSLPTVMRGAPLVALSGLANTNSSGGTITALTTSNIMINYTVTAAGTGFLTGNFTVSADL